MKLNKCYKSRKADKKYFTLINLIIITVILILMIPLIEHAFYKNKVNNNILDCATILQSSNFKNIAFQNDYSTPTDYLRKLLQKECIMYNTNLNNGKELYNVINNCWEEVAKGYNFLSNYQGSLCFVCGDFNVTNVNKVKKEYFSNIYLLKNNKKLFVEQKGINLNNYSLLNEKYFPNSNRIVLIYFIKQNNVDKNLKEKFVGSLKEKILNEIPILNLLDSNFLYENNPNYIYGIVFSSKTNGYTTIKINNINQKCDYVVIPQNKLKK